MFLFEKRLSPENIEKKPQLHIKSQYDVFLPEDFRGNPQKYIEEHGENIKSGEITYDEDGRAQEDPTASKFLPEWHNKQGEIVQPISKKVNREKVRTKTEAEGEKFEAFGIYRKWKHKDMVFDLDVENKTVTGIVPVDWEASHLDRKKLVQMISKFSPESCKKSRRSYH